MIDIEIKKAWSISRSEVIKQVTRDKTHKRLVFVVSFDPRLPSIPDITSKHWHSMTTMDPYLKNVLWNPL